jgi:hypothetical protein
MSIVDYSEGVAVEVEKGASNQIGRRRGKTELCVFFAIEQD